MALYEYVFIARQDINASQVEGISNALTEVLEQNGGKVHKSEYWGLKSLAYKIKKNRKGHYVLLNIETPYEALVEMERQAGLNEDILRFMTIRVDELEEGQSAVLRNKADKERRGPRRQKEAN